MDLHVMMDGFIRSIAVKFDQVLSMCHLGEILKLEREVKIKEKHRVRGGVETIL